MYVMFLDESGDHSLNDKGFLTIEARDASANNKLLEQYSDIMTNGSGQKYPISSSRLQEKILKIEFVTKEQNENGHQLADLAAYPIAKHVLYPERPNPAFEVLKPKLRARNGQIEGCGLKIFP